MLSAWRSCAGANTRRLPAKQGETSKEQVNRVFAALNDNDSFKVKLFDFVTGQMAHDTQFNLGEGAS